MELFKKKNKKQSEEVVQEPTKEVSNKEPMYDIPPISEEASEVVNLRNDVEEIKSVLNAIIQHIKNREEHL